MNFASDNVSPVHPRIMSAIAAANEGPAMPYGGDDLTARVTACIRALFEHEAEVFLVTTGTAANALALSAMVDPFGGVLAHEEAHVNTDECGAPELFTGGAKIIPLPGKGGRIAPHVLEERLAAFVHGEHQVLPQALSLTNATEYGQVQTPEDIAALANVAHAHDLKVHMDGARLANALVTLGCSPAEATWKAGVDALSLGLTKNGAMCAEAVVFFDTTLAERFMWRRKRAGQLLSKGRYLAAQFLAALEDGLWLDLARHANAMAALLADGLAELPGVRLAHPVQANEIFVHLPRPLHKALVKAGAIYYPWHEEERTVLARLVTSWSTAPEEVNRLLACARSLV